uniref:Glutamate-rich protein 6 n=1 Tax=Geotrypetes seraphini TaxID=260995 RepID=A0A6P8SDH0_GEOSA|nr:glutamate-rich protein 6 [Geotrypetes seraphini]
MSGKEDEEKTAGSQWEEGSTASEGYAVDGQVLYEQEETSSRTLDTLNLTYISSNIFDPFHGTMAPGISISSQTEDSWLKRHYYRNMGGDVPRHLSEEKCLSTSCSSEKEIYSALAREFSDISILSDTEFTAAYLVLLEESLRTLPSVGPPTILAYKPESSEKDRIFPELEMLQDHFTYVPCEFCGRQLKPFPTYKQYLMDSSEELCSSTHRELMIPARREFFCCKQYQNLYEFLANEEKNLLNEDEIEPISTGPRKSYISEIEGQEKLLHDKQNILWSKSKTEALTGAQGDLERQTRPAKESQKFPQSKQMKLRQEEPLSVTSQKSLHSELERPRGKKKYDLSDYSDNEKDNMERKKKVKSLQAHKSHERSLERAKEKQDLSDFSDDVDHLQRGDKTKTIKATPRKSFSTKLKRQRVKKEQDFSDFSDDDHFQEKDESSTVSVALRKSQKKDETSSLSNGDTSDISDDDKDHVQRKGKTKTLKSTPRKSYGTKPKRHREKKKQDFSDFSDDDHFQEKDESSTVSVALRKSQKKDETSSLSNGDTSDISDDDKDHVQRKGKTKTLKSTPRKSYGTKPKRHREKKKQDFSDFSEDEDHFQEKDESSTVSLHKSHHERQRIGDEQDLSDFSDDEDDYLRTKHKAKADKLKRQVREKQSLSDSPLDKQKKLLHKDKTESVSSASYMLHEDEPDSLSTKERQKLAKPRYDKQKSLQQDDKSETVFSTQHKPHQDDLDKQGLQSKETQKVQELPYSEEKRLWQEDILDALDKSYSKQQTKEKLAQRLQEGYLGRQYGSEISFSSEVTALESQNLRTISFNLTDPPKDKWTLTAVQWDEMYTDQSYYNITCDFSVACEKMMPREFLEKYYKEGGKFLTLFPDGTAQLFYPSGNLAIIVIENDMKDYCCIVYADKPNNADFLAMFDSNGKGTCYYPNGTIWININAVGGDYADDTGNRVKTWKWKNNLNSSNPPPFKPIFISLNLNIGIRILGQDKIVVSFLAMGRQARFSVGAKVEVTATESLPLKQVSKEDLLLFASKIKIQILLNKLNEFLNCPSNRQWTKIKPRSYLLSQTQKLIYLCKLSKLGRDVGTLVQTVIDENSRPM